ncbi:hypothetical protein B0H14DRAFT_2635644 [Mycena olivaceomarginata]|nr:hypothetical protein B0H14DRAFT_2635644 [Mycena olivaceomarginata]
MEGFKHRTVYGNQESGCSNRKGPVKHPENWETRSNVEEWYGGIQRSQIGVNQLNTKLMNISKPARETELILVKYGPKNPTWKGCNKTITDVVQFCHETDRNSWNGVPHKGGKIAATREAYCSLLPGNQGQESREPLPRTGLKDNIQKRFKHRTAVGCTECSRAHNSATQARGSRRVTDRILQSLPNQEGQNASELIEFGAAYCITMRLGENKAEHIRDANYNQIMVEERKDSKRITVRESCNRTRSGSEEETITE